MNEAFTSIVESRATESLAQKRKEKMDALFAGKHYSVVEEVHLPADQRFYTALGLRARHGFKLKNEDTGEHIYVGFRVLCQAAEVYGAVILPEKEQVALKKFEADKAAAKLSSKL